MTRQHGRKEWLDARVLRRLHDRQGSGDAALHSQRVEAQRPVGKRPKIAGSGITSAVGSSDWEDCRYARGHHHRWTLRDAKVTASDGQRPRLQSHPHSGIPGARCASTQHATRYARSRCASKRKRRHSALDWVAHQRLAGPLSPRACDQPACARREICSARHLTSGAVWNRRRARRAESSRHSEHEGKVDGDAITRALSGDKRKQRRGGGRGPLQRQMEGQHEKERGQSQRGQKRRPLPLRRRCAVSRTDHIAVDRARLDGKSGTRATAQIHLGGRRTEQQQGLLCAPQHSKQ